MQLFDRENFLNAAEIKEELLYSVNTLHASEIVPITTSEQETH